MFSWKIQTNAHKEFFFKRKKEKNWRDRARKEKRMSQNERVLEGGKTREQEKKEEKNPWMIKKEIPKNVCFRMQKRLLKE